MNRYIVAILIFTGAFLLSREQKKSSLAKPSFDSLGSSSIQQKKMPVKNPKASVSPPPAAFLRNSSGGVLFQHLFAGPFLANRENLQFIQDRFNQPYPRESWGHHSAYEREVANRLGILRALQVQQTLGVKVEVHSAMTKLYRGIITGSKIHPWTLRRQALRNLSSLPGALSELERQKLFSQTEPGLIAVSAMSDQQLVEALFER